MNENVEEKRKKRICEEKNAKFFSSPENEEKNGKKILSIKNPCRSFFERQDYDRNFESTYLWDQKILNFTWKKSFDVNDPKFFTPPISAFQFFKFFKFLPLRNQLENLKFEGMIVEIPNFDGFREAKFFLLI